jgi:hypothetical protein
LDDEENKNPTKVRMRPGANLTSFEARFRVDVDGLGTTLPYNDGGARVYAGILRPFGRIRGPLAGP